MDRGRAHRGRERGRVPGIGLTRPLDPADLAAALDAALPDGLDVLAAAEAEGTPLVERIEASEWRIELPGVTRTTCARAVGALEGADAVVVERVTPSGRRQVDVRGRARRRDLRSAQRVDVCPRHEDCAIMTAVVRQTTPAVRPETCWAADVVAGLKLPAPAKATRMAQGLLDDRGRLTDRSARTGLPPAPTGEVGAPAAAGGWRVRAHGYSGTGSLPARSGRDARARVAASGEAPGGGGVA